MKEKIIHSINKRIREDVSDPLYEEVVQHLKFCQTKCETFYGRKEILDRCKAYLQVNILHNCIGATLHLILSLYSTIILWKQKYKEIQQSAFLKLRTRSLQYILFRMIDVTRSWFTVGQGVARPQWFLWQPKKSGIVSANRTLSFDTLEQRQILLKFVFCFTVSANKFALSTAETLPRSDRCVYLIWKGALFSDWRVSNLIVPHIAYQDLFVNSSESWLACENNIILKQENIISWLKRLVAKISRLQLKDGCTDNDSLRYGLSN